MSHSSGGTSGNGQPRSTLADSVRDATAFIAAAKREADVARLRSAVTQLQATLKALIVVLGEIPKPDYDAVKAAVRASMPLLQTARVQEQDWERAVDREDDDFDESDYIGRQLDATIERMQGPLTVLESSGRMMGLPTHCIALLRDGKWGSNLDVINGAEVEVRAIEDAVYSYGVRATAETLMGSGDNDRSGNGRGEASPGNWSAPLSKKELCACLSMTKTDVSAYLKTLPVEKLTRERIRIDLDSIPAVDRKKIDEYVSRRG